MYPPKFEYHRAGSVDEALALLEQNPYAKLLAGGHSLLPVMKLRLADPGVLIDIGRISELKGISNGDGTVRIGALTTHAMVEKADGLPDALPQAAAWIGDPMVRNRGTVGGNVAHADPASDLPTVFTALGATFHVDGPNGSRAISADNFFIDLFATDLGENEILTAVEIPAPSRRTGTAYAKMFNPASRYAIVGAAASVTVQGNQCEAARVAVGGLTPTATRCPSVEAALDGQKLDEDVIKAAAARVVDDLDDDLLVGDMHASAAYRKEMAPTFVARALTQAFDRAR